MRDQEAGGGALLALRLVCWVRFSGRGVEALILVRMVISKHLKE